MLMQNGTAVRPISSQTSTMLASHLTVLQYHLDRKLDKAQFLHFATCKYIDGGHHIILSGAGGDGKPLFSVRCEM